MSNIEEIIGKVRIDYTYATEVDKASDDVLLDELLDIVKNNDVDSFDKIIVERRNPRILYYLSSVRSNLINWFPFNKSARILEIGAECGTITGLLCSRGQLVHAIERDKRMAVINANRNKDKDNLKLIVGDYYRILSNSNEKYDYITLLNPIDISKDDLLLLESHLEPSGKLIIAVENRIGLTRLAGASANECFNSTKKGLEKLIVESGPKEYSFYYPYPDHRFTTSIYSDWVLPRKGDLTNNIRNFDKERLVYWDESKVFDDITDECVFPSFSNSFLVIIGENESDRVLYAKISDDRDSRYQIITKIVDCSGKTIVTKTNKNPDGFEHVKAIHSNEEKLRNVFCDNAEVCKSVLHEDCVEFEFIAGISMEDKLREAVENNDDNDVITVLDEYQRLVNCMSNGSLVDIDLIPANIIECDGHYTIIDYEWVVNAPVSLEFVFWRGLFTSLAFSLLSEERKSIIYSHYGITQEMMDSYLNEEIKFQRKVSGVSFTLRDYIEAVPFKSLYVDNLKNDLESTKVALNNANNELDIIKSNRAWKILKKLGIVKG